MILNKQKWNNEQIENNFFLFKKEQGAENCGDRDRFSSKILPILEKKPLQVCSFINAGLRVVNLSNRWTNRWTDKASIHAKKKSRLVQFDKKNELVKEAC